MAVKYCYGTGWAGGAATWKIGGPGGATTSNPTAADDVVFDSASPACTVSGTSAVCRSIDFSGASPLGTGLSGSPYAATFKLNANLNLTVGGTAAPANGTPPSLILFSSAMAFSISTTGTTQVGIASTAGVTQTIDTKGKTMPGLGATVAVTGTYQLISGWAGNAIGDVVWNGGTLDFNGTTCVFTSISIGASGTVALNGGYQITCSAQGQAWNCSGNVTGSGGGTITLSAATNVFFTGGGHVYNALTFSSLGATPSGINGANTFNGLVSATGIANVYPEFQLNANNTFNGGLTVTGNSATNRVLLAGSVGTPQVIMPTGTLTLTNVDVYNLALTGNPSQSISSLGDCGGTSGSPGFAFTVNTGTSNGKGGVYRYCVAAGAATYAATTTWSTTSGGASGASTPLPQDTCRFDSHSGSGAGRVITLNLPRIGGIQMDAGIVGTISFAFTATGSAGVFASPNFSNGGLCAVVCGDFNLSSAFSGTITGLTGGSQLALTGSHSYVLSTQGFNFGSILGAQLLAGTFLIGVSLSLAGSWTLGSDLTVNNQYDANAGVRTVITAATFDTAGYNMTAGHLAMTLGTLNMGNGSTWNVGILNTTSVTTLNCQTSTVLQGVLAANGQTFYALTGQNVSTLGDGDLQIIITGTASTTIYVTSINIYGITAARQLQISRYVTLVVSGSFNVNGNASYDVTLNSTAPTIAHTLSYTGAGTVQCDYLTIQDSNPVQTATWFSGLHSTLVSDYGNWVVQVLGPTMGDSTSGMTIGGVVTRVASVSMTDSATSLTVDGTAVRIASVSLSALTSLTVGAEVTEVAAVALEGDSGLTVGATLLISASVLMADSSAELIAAGVIQQAAVAPMVAMTDLSLDVLVTQVASVAMTDESTGLFIGSVIEVAGVFLSTTTSGLFIASVIEIDAVHLAAATATLTVGASVTYIVSVSLTANTRLRMPAAHVIQIASVGMTGVTDLFFGLRSKVFMTGLAQLYLHGDLIPSVTLRAISTLTATGPLPIVVTGEVAMAATTALFVFGLDNPAGAFRAAALASLLVAATVRLAGDTVFRARTALIVEAESGAPPRVAMHAVSGLVVHGEVERHGAPSLEDQLVGVGGQDPILMGATGYMDNVFTTRLVGDSE